MKLAIIGRTHILYETAIALSKAGHQVVSIITAKAAPEYTKNENDFYKLAKTLNASFIATNSLDIPEIEEYCKNVDIGVSINWISIIKQIHIDLFRLGILNSHHGDLPKFRGNASSNWAIIKGEKKIVNSIHFMEGENLDCGKIICQETFYLNNNSSITDVYKWSEETIPSMFLKAIDIIEKDSNFALKYADPNNIESFRCFPRLPFDNFINWDSPVIDIHNLIRAACHPFSGAYTFHWDKNEVKKLYILKSRIIQFETKDLSTVGHVLNNNSETGESLVRCADGIIALEKCRYEGENEEFNPGQKWKSIRLRLGVNPNDWSWAIYNKISQTNRFNE